MLAAKPSESKAILTIVIDNAEYGGARNYVRFVKVTDDYVEKTGSNAYYPAVIEQYGTYELIEDIQSSQYANTKYSKDYELTAGEYCLIAKSGSDGLSGSYEGGVVFDDTRHIQNILGFSFAFSGKEDGKVTFNVFDE